MEVQNEAWMVETFPVKLAVMYISGNGISQHPSAP